MTHLWTTAEVAAHHDVTPESVRRWHRDGLLRAVKITATQMLFDTLTAKAFKKPPRGRPHIKATATPVRCYEDELSALPDPPWVPRALAAIRERGPLKATEVAAVVGLETMDVDAWLDLCAQSERLVSRQSTDGSVPRYALREVHE